MLKHVVEKIKPALSNNTCGNSYEDRYNHYVGKSSKMSNDSCNVNEKVFSYENVDTDKNKGYLSRVMPLSVHHK